MINSPLLVFLICVLASASAGVGQIDQRRIVSDMINSEPILFKYFTENNLHWIVSGLEDMVSEHTDSEYNFLGNVPIFVREDSILWYCKENNIKRIGVILLVDISFLSTGEVVTTCVTSTSEYRRKMKRPLFGLSSTLKLYYRYNSESRSWVLSRSERVR